MARELLDNSVNIALWNSEIVGRALSNNSMDIAYGISEIVQWVENYWITLWI